MPVDRDGQAIEAAVGQAGLLDRVPVLRLGADVDVHLAGEVRRDARRVEVAVVGETDHGLVLRIWTGHDVLEGHVPETGQLPGFAGVGAGDDAGPGPALLHFLAVHEDPVLGPPALGEQRVFRGQIGRAEPLPLRRSPRVLTRRPIPQEHGIGRRREVLALGDLERLPVDRPPGDERALAAVGANDAGGVRRDLVVHQEGELAVAALEGAQTVRNPHHPVAADGITHRQDRERLDAGDAREQIGVLGRAGPDVLGTRFRRRQQ